MGNKFRFAICALLMIAASGFFVVTASATDDWGVVSLTVLKHKLNDRFTLKFFPELRWNDDAENFYYQQYRFGFEYDATKYLVLGLNYEFIDAKNSAGKWLYENRLVLLAGPHVDLAGFAFTDNNRLEYRYFDIESDHFRYRNEFIIERPITIAGFKIIPFVSAEPWYDLKMERVNFIRYQFGLSRRFNKNLMCALFYRLEDTNKGKGNWDSAGYLGIKTVIDF